MEAHIPLHTTAKTKSKIAWMQDQEMGDGPPPWGSKAAERQGELYWIPGQENYPIAAKIDLTPNKQH